MSIGDQLAAVAPRQVQFAGFWRRLAAAFVDLILLAALGWSIGHFFQDRLVEMGQFGRAIGFPLELAYFGILNSRVGAGATIGKRVFGIQVIARDGSHISVLRSFWRAAVYIVPPFLNGLDLTFLNFKAGPATAVAALDCLLVFGVFGASIYLYLANWRTRQVVHDLAAGTFVVRSAATAVERHISKIHVVIVLAWLVLTAAAVPLAEQYAPSSWKTWIGQKFGASYDDLQAVQSVVISEPDVQSSTVTSSTTVFAPFGKPATTTTFLAVTATLRGRVDDPERVADAMAANILTRFPDILNRDKLTITIRVGYDIGIWSSWTGNSYTFTPAEWKERIQQKTKTGTGAA